MTRSPWRTFLTVFLLVFLGGLGVSGAAALWSMQTNVTAQVATGTWGAQPEPSPTPSPTSTASPSETSSPSATAAPVPSATSTPWNWQLTHDSGKAKGAGVFALGWTPPPGLRVVVEVEGAQVEMLSGREATVTLGRGPSCYELSIYAEGADGRAHELRKVVTYHPGNGHDGTIDIKDRCLI